MRSGKSKEAISRWLERGRILLIGVVISACGTTTPPGVKPSTLQNPPPSVLFSKFDRVELKPIALAPAYLDNPANAKALALLQNHFDERVAPALKGAGGKFSKWGRTLVITPRIEHIKYVDAQARDWGGMLKGSPAILLKVKYTDSMSGKLIAEAEFFQRADGLRGQLGMGDQNGAMLERIALLVAKYYANNTKQYLGGESGATFEDLNKND